MGTVRCFFYKFIIPLFTIKLITGLYCLKYVLILLRIISSFHSFFEGTDEESVEERRRRIGFVSDLLVEGGLLAASHGKERERERETCSCFCFCCCCCCCCCCNQKPLTH